MASAAAVAPPRGERGLKCANIEGAEDTIAVAPPRGERGLKYLFGIQQLLGFLSLPLVGSVD